MIDAYVQALRNRLPGPRGARRDLMRELTDGLRDTASVYQMNGMSRQDAERRAVEESGEPEQLVPQYRDALAVIQGRRTAMLYAVTAPGSILAWATVWSAPGARETQEHGTQPPLAMLCWQLIDYAGLASGLVAVCTLGLLVLGGRRGWPNRPLILLPALAGAFHVLVTLVCSTLGNLVAGGGVVSDVAPVSPLLGALGGASILVGVWQGSSSWRAVRAVAAGRERDSAVAGTA